MQRILNVWCPINGCLEGSFATRSHQNPSELTLLLPPSPAFFALLLMLPPHPRFISRPPHRNDLALSRPSLLSPSQISPHRKSGLVDPDPTTTSAVQYGACRQPMGTCYQIPEHLTVSVSGSRGGRWSLPRMMAEIWRSGVGSSPRETFIATAKEKEGGVERSPPSIS